MIFLYVFSGIIVLLLLYMRFEAGFLKVERVRFTKSSKSLRIVHLSDIHINRLKVPVWKIKKAIEQEKPDIVVMTGDYIEKAAHVHTFLDFLEEIKGRYPIYLCLGNHDHKAFSKLNTGIRQFIESISAMGVTVLHNDSVCFEKDRKIYNIIGVDDLKEGTADIKKALNSRFPAAYANIAISHNPDIVFLFPRGGVDYLFCGHFHGGQIWLPFNLEFNMLRRDKLCKMGIRWGLHKINGINLYINRGLGNVALPLRFLSRPEITVYHLP